LKAIGEFPPTAISSGTSLSVFKELGMAVPAKSGFRQFGKTATPGKQSLVFSGQLDLRVFAARFC